jgi:hypothetical protein
VSGRRRAPRSGDRRPLRIAAARPTHRPCVRRAATGSREGRLRGSRREAGGAASEPRLRRRVPDVLEHSRTGTRSTTRLAPPKPGARTRRRPPNTRPQPPADAAAPIGHRVGTHRSGQLGGAWRARACATAVTGGAASGPGRNIYGRLSSSAAAPGPVSRRLRTPSAQTAPRRCPRCKRRRTGEGAIRIGKRRERRRAQGRHCSCGAGSSGSRNATRACVFSNRVSAVASSSCPRVSRQWPRSARK